ncbi:hypothetical protein [Argonema galeatum]
MMPPASPLVTVAINPLSGSANNMPKHSKMNATAVCSAIAV